MTTGQQLAISFVAGRSLRARAVSNAATVLVKPAVYVGGHLLDLPWPFAVAELAAKCLPKLSGVTVEPVRVGEMYAEMIRPAAGPRSPHVLLYLHGGAFYVGGPNTHRRAVSHLVRETGQTALVVDYRQSPRHPVSSSVRDCAAAFEWLIAQGYRARDISIVGDSAGGFLSVATAITVRGRGLGNPAGLVCWSPGLDFTPLPHRRGRYRDALIGRRAYNALCRSLAKVESRSGGADGIGATTSLLRADVTGLPATLIQVGSQEFVAPDAVDFARYLADNGVPTTLELWDRQIHVFPVLADILPEGMAALRRAAVYLNELHAATPGTQPAA
ncbi:alpha/beta hydrolase [Mycobacterium sp. UM_Kg1]|uniref:alpha/beta hydrolase n=1 Tax=Mycobacterium sp. UM_Kg1 TaxID=1545691 RepID=UPI000A84A70E|nr:alpha/beta hydrolase [Mycobacterium sp. UM_Kg1]